MGNLTEMTQHLSIRVLAPLLLLLPVVVVSGIILFVSSGAARRSAERQAYAELSQIQSTATERVDALLATPVRAVALNHDLLTQGKLDPDQPAAWRQTLLAESAAFPTLSAITWGSEDGAATWIARYGKDGEKRFYAILDAGSAGQMREYPVMADDVIGREPSSTFDFDPRGRPWYRAAVAKGAPTWSEPYAWAGDEDGEETTLGLSYSRPVLNADGKRIGVISADLNLNDISAYLARLRVGKTGLSFIVDREGRLIASSKPVALTDEKNQLLLAINAADMTIASLAKHWSSQTIDGIAGGRGKVEAAAGPVFTTRSLVGMETGLQWSVITVVPEADFMADAQQTRQKTLWISAVIVLLTLVVGYLTSRQLSKPVVALEAHFKQLGAGELDRTIDLHQTSEYERLSNVVNQMSLDLKDRIELRRSLATAMEVQQSLLPDALPKVRGLDVAGNSNYCDQTGGDYYDFLDLSDLSDHSVAVVVGDVMGHGIAAAMLMATARGILRSRSCEAGSTGELISHLNEQLVEVTQGSRFMTMVMASIDSDTRQLRWASAGHDMPFIFDPTTQDFIEIEGGGLPLGIMVEEPYEEYAAGPFTPGTIIGFMTDGVFEARNNEEKLYGKERIMQIIRDHHQASASEIARELEQDLDHFQQATRQEDDITYVIVKFTDQP